MNDQLKRFRTPGLVGLAAFTVGVGVGYLLGKRNKTVDDVVVNLDTIIAEDKQFQEVRADLKRRRGTYVIPPMPDVAQKIFINPDADTKNYLEEVIAPKLIHPDPPPEPPELVTKSIFADDDWDYEKEKASRSPDKPYVIHKDEFYAEELDYTQTTLTYYAGDNIMVDEDDSPIYNHDTITGPLPFGHGSGSKTVVHIRNDKLKAEYEVIFDPGLYSVEVLGLEIENNTRVQDLKHARNMKFRDD